MLLAFNHTNHCLPPSFVVSLPHTNTHPLVCTCQNTHTTHTHTFTRCVAVGHLSTHGCSPHIWPRGTGSQPRVLGARGSSRPTPAWARTAQKQRTPARQLLPATQPRAQQAQPPTLLLRASSVAKQTLNKPLDKEQGGREKGPTLLARGEKAQNTTHGAPRKKEAQDAPSWCQSRPAKQPRRSLSALQCARCKAAHHASC